MSEVSTIRLWVMRAAYALIFVGLAMMIWPLIVTAPRGVEHMRGAVWSMLTAVSILAAIGIRYPLRMVPLLLFELVWKTVWLIAIGLPLRSSNHLTGANADTWTDCVVGVIVCIVAIPWGYVFRKYVREASDPWFGTRRLAAKAA